MSEKTLKIGALARLTKTNPAVIREYERLGLLLTAERAGEGLLTRGPSASRVYVTGVRVQFPMYDIAKTVL